MVVLEVDSGQTDEGPALHGLAIEQCAARIILTGDAGRTIFEAAMRPGHECGLTMSSVLSMFKKLTRDILTGDLAAAVAADALVAAGDALPFIRERNSWPPPRRGASPGPHAAR